VGESKLWAVESCVYMNTDTVPRYWYIYTSDVKMMSIMHTTLLPYYSILVVGYSPY
jgi:hypothetical protein